MGSLGDTVDDALLHTRIFLVSVAITVAFVQFSPSSPRDPFYQIRAANPNQCADDGSALICWNVHCRGRRNIPMAKAFRLFHP